MWHGIESMQVNRVMNANVTTEEIPAGIAKEICLSNELQASSKELRASVQSSKRLHFKDLVTFSI
jgi:hypothetical protein